VDPTLDIGPQGPFDVIFYKITSQLTAKDDASKLILKNFDDYFKANPNCANIDPVACQAKTVDRASMNAVLADVQEELKSKMSNSQIITHLTSSRTSDAKS
jgi:hypothetical protein